MADEFFAPAPPGSPPEKIPFYVTSSGINCSPGPGGISVRSNILDDIPKTYLKGRTEIPIETNQAPYSNLGSTIGTGRKFTLKGRPEEKKEIQPVAPEYIPPPFGSDAKKATLHGRTEIKTENTNPGPGEYKDTERIGKNARKSTFHGPHERGMPVRNDSPGPGTYLPQMPPNKPSTPNIRIGHRIEKNVTNDIPGPGQYKVKSNIGENKSRYVIREKWSHESVNLNPGPASYDTQRPTLENVTKITLKGRTERTPEVNQAPYRDVSKAFCDSPRYSLRSRYDYNPVNDTPVASYIPPEFGHDCRRISIKRRSNSERIDSMPGPGQYQPKSSKDFGSARKSTFHGTRRRSNANTDSPGPGEYYPDYRPIKKSSPRFTMKGSKYQEQREQSGPYVNLPSTLQGPRYSFRCRPTLTLAYG